MVSELCRIILICANVFPQMRNSRGVGADYRLARSCSSLIAHLDPADVFARVPARASRFVCVCECWRAGGGGEVTGTPLFGFVDKCWTLWIGFYLCLELDWKFTHVFIYEVFEIYLKKITPLLIQNGAKLCQRHKVAIRLQGN